MARQHKRLALDEPARLHPNGWSSVEAQLLECSASGFRALCTARFGAGAQIVLEIPGLGPVRAHVLWRRGDAFAAAFAEPLDLARARFMSINREAVLARLLEERAAASASGRSDDEQRLRLRILHGLPVRKDD